MAMPEQKAMPLVTIRRGFQLTIPGEIREKLQLSEGDRLEMRVEDEKIVMRLVRATPRGQDWYWAPEWQAKEREADEDLEQGRIVGPFGSAEEMRACLDKLSDSDDSNR